MMKFDLDILTLYQMTIIYVYLCVCVKKYIYIYIYEEFRCKSL